MGILQQNGASQGTVNSGEYGRVLSGGPKILRHISTSSRQANTGGLMVVMKFEVEASLTTDEIGAQVIENLNMQHSNPQTSEIARNQAATIIEAGLGDKNADDDLLMGELLYVENTPKQSVSKKIGDVDAQGKQKVYNNNNWRWATKDDDRIRIARLLNAQPPKLFGNGGSAPAAPQQFQPQQFQQPAQQFAPQAYQPQGGTAGYAPQQQYATAPAVQQYAPQPMTMAAPQPFAGQQHPQGFAGQPQQYAQQPTVGHMPPQGAGAWGAPAQ